MRINWHNDGLDGWQAGCAGSWLSLRKTSDGYLVTFAGRNTTIDATTDRGAKCAAVKWCKERVRKMASEWGVSANG